MNSHLETRTRHNAGKNDQSMPHSSTYLTGIVWLR